MSRSPADPLCISSTDPLPLWESLVIDCGAHVVVITRSGRLAYMNAERAKAIGLERPQGPGPMMLSDTMPSAVATELLEHAEIALRESEPRRVDLVLNGQHCRATIRPLSLEFDGEPCVLIVGCRSYRGAPAPDERGVHSARALDLGPIKGLTPREREILGLIGEGLTSAQIADRLNRSVKTVAWHRVSIGQKLGGKTRVELAQLAMECGLCAPLHAELRKSAELAGGMGFAPASIESPR